jgi:hypothetical protein
MIRRLSMQGPELGAIHCRCSVACNTWYSSEVDTNLERVERMVDSCQHWE